MWFARSLRLLWLGALPLAAGAPVAGCGSSDASDGARPGAAGSDGGSTAPDATADADGAAAEDAADASDSEPPPADADDGGSDADLDSGTDAPQSSDAGPDGPTGPAVCGDGWRDPLTEECDDGNTVSGDSCSNDCRVQELPVVLPPVDAKRKLGAGRHPISAGSSGFAVAFVDSETSPPSVSARAFGAKGEPGALLAIDSGGTALANADPVVAALPGSKLAVVWTDLNADGDGWGIAIRIVDGATGSVGPRLRANATTTLNQHSPDAVWTGSELVVAWEDQSQLLTKKTDVRLRRFDATGKPLAAEQVLAGMTAQERKLALATLQGGWAACWRSGTTTGEILHVRAGGKSWAIEPIAWGPDSERPALVELDATHLLAVFVEGGLVGGAPRLRGAIVDTAQSAIPSTFPIEPLVAPYDTDASLAQTQPALARAGDRIYLAWRSERIIGEPEGEELWLKELAWTASEGGFALDLSLPEIALPRWPEHHDGDQEFPALAGAPLWPEGALATAWVDQGQTFGTGSGTPEVVVELIPTPVLRIAGDGGSGG